MNRFVKLNMYVKEVADVIVSKNNGKIRNTWRITFKRRDKVKQVLVNVDEIATVSLDTSLSYDTDKCFINDDRRLKTTADTCLDAEVNLDLPEDKREYIYNLQCGIVILKHGISTNLGLNGTEINQTMYITKESYEELLNILL